MNPHYHSNPYETPRDPGMAERAFGDFARLVQSSFLFRVIEFEQPFQGVLTYSCWWWRQKIDINGYNVWFRISWIRIHSLAEFEFADVLGTGGRIKGKILIDFSRSLRIRRFRLFLAGELVYDEQNQ